jgi:hypothetical protein
MLAEQAKSWHFSKLRCAADSEMVFEGDGAAAAAAAAAVLLILSMVLQALVPAWGLKC